jgi:hypothetical protein
VTPPTPKTPATQTLDCADAAKYIGLSVWWLKMARRHKRGPAFLRIGRTIRYRVTDLDRWLAAHVIQTNDSRAS